MIKYGKSTQNAIAAMSSLAAAFRDGRCLSSHDIARSRGLPQTLVAKLLTNLSQCGLVRGATGPHGGYALARPPAQISLYDVASVFERINDHMTCPFGPGYCGNNDPCPLHDQLSELNGRFEKFLRQTHFDVFASVKRHRPRAVKRGRARTKRHSSGIQS